MLTLFSGRRIFSVSLLTILSLAMFFHASKVSGQTAISEKTPELKLERKIEKELRGGQSHSFTVKIKSGEFAQIVVEQRGIDVSVNLFAPNGARLFERDAPNGAYGAELLTFFRQEAGVYKIEIKPLQQNALPGKYQIELKARRIPDERDLLEAATEESFYQANGLRAQNSPEASAKALQKFDDSIAGWQKLGDKYWESLALEQSAFVAFDGKSAERPLERLNRALALTREQTDKYREAMILHTFGELYDAVADYEKAVEYFTQSANADKSAPETEAYALESLGVTLLKNAKWQTAKETLDRAASLYETQNKQTELARVLNYAGVALSNLNQTSEAVKFYERAAAISKALNDAPGEALALSNAAHDYKNEGKFEKALEYLNKSVELRKSADLKAEIAENLAEIIDVYKLQKKTGEAAKIYPELIALYQKLADRRAEADAINRLGVLRSDAGEHEKALELFHKALQIFEELKDRENRALVLKNIAYEYSQLNKTAEAINFYNRAANEYKEINDLKNAGAALSNLPGLHLKLAEPEKTFAVLDSMLEIYRALKDEEVEAQTLNSYGVYLSEFYKLQRKPDYLKRAVPFFERSLAIYKRLGNKTEEARIYKNLGSLYGESEGLEKSLEYFQRALAMWRELKKVSEEALTLREIASAFQRAQNDEKTFAYYMQALELQQTLNEPGKLAEIYNGIGGYYQNKEDFPNALKYFRMALPLYVEAKETEGLLILYKNLANAFQALGDYDNAAKTYVKYYEMAKESNNRLKEIDALSSMADLAMTLGDNDSAERFLFKAFTMFDDISDREMKASIAISVGMLLLKPENNEKEKEQVFFILGKAAEIYGANGNLIGLSNSWQAIARAHFVYKNYPQAEAFLLKALPPARAGQALRIESQILGSLMTLKAKQGNAEQAIFYGKQSVNLLQQVRSSIKDIEKELQKSFVEKNETLYRRLADLLAERGRLGEAQQVLEMLKDEENFEFVRRDAKEIENLAKRVDLRADERAALENYSKIIATLAADSARLAALQEKKNRLAEGAAFAEQPEYETLVKKIDSANKAFEIFVQKELAEQLSAQAKEQIRFDRSLQGRLQRWGAGTVALSTVISEDRYRVILTTPKIQIDAKTDIKSAELNKKIFEFRAALLNPAIDPTLPARELYKILIPPAIEKALADAGAKTLVWTLDGTLRYIPMATLHDGKQYLAQKYRNVVVTSTARKNLEAAVEKNWRVLGAGVTNASEVAEPTTHKKVAFEELKGVREELQTIVRREPDETGVLPGMRLLDAEFTEQSFKDQLGKLDENDRRRYNVVHLATHFRLGSDTANSFLLLGNNQPLTLEEVKNSSELDLTDVELVTLSACNTGFGGLINGSRAELEKLKENNGREVDSLAAFIESRGAKSVMATLWAVADESTQLLMAEFYRLRKENPAMTKAEALQTAQAEMIEGRLKPTSAEAKERLEKTLKKTRSDVLDGTIPFAFDANKPYSHPYFWSPFVLIGNWR